MTDHQPTLQDLFRVVNEMRGELRADIRELKVRMSSLEERMTGVQRDLARFEIATHERFDVIQQGLDRIDERLERVERRTGLIDAHT